jgi:hypothetical protein
MPAWHVTPREPPAQEQRPSLPATGYAAVIEHRSNRLLDRLEQHADLIGEPWPSESSRLYHLPLASHEEVEPWLSDIFENQLEEPRWHESLRVGSEGAS